MGVKGGQKCRSNKPEQACRVPASTGGAGGLSMATGCTHAYAHTRTSGTVGNTCHTGIHMRPCSTEKLYLVASAIPVGARAHGW